MMSRNILLSAADTPSDLVNATHCLTAESKNNFGYLSVNQQMKR